METSKQLQVEEEEEPTPMQKLAIMYNLNDSEITPIPIPHFREDVSRSWDLYAEFTYHDESIEIEPINTKFFPFVEMCDMNELD